MRCQESPSGTVWMKKIRNIRWQAYAQTTDYDDDDTEDFYDQLQEVRDQAPEKDILVVQGDWNAKTGEDASKNWKGTRDQDRIHVVQSGRQSSQHSQQ